MYESTDYVGRRGLMMHAIGGVDLALWDLYGKIEGKPVHALLGGAKRDRQPAYGTIYPMAKTEEEVRAQVAAGQAKKLRNFKFAADPWWLDDVALTGRLLRAAREQAGDGGAHHCRCGVVVSDSGGRAEAVSDVQGCRDLVSGSAAAAR